MQFIFSPDGVSGTCYEHSPAEGIVLVQVIEKPLENVAAQQQGAPCRRSLLDDRRGSNSSVNGEPMRQQPSTKTDPFPAPKRLAWKIDDDIRSAIETATLDVDRYILYNHFFFLLGIKKNFFSQKTTIFSRIIQGLSPTWTFGSFASRRTERIESRLSTSAPMSTSN